MKKLLMGAAVVASLSSLPVMSVSAMGYDQGSSCGCGSSNYSSPSVNISEQQDQNYNLAKNSENNNTNYVEAYSNKTVSYEALYYVKYTATETNFFKQFQNSNNMASLTANATNDVSNQFNTNGM